MTESKAGTEDSRTVVSVVRSIWRAWSSEARSFNTEAAMQGAFRDTLQERLASPWIVTREVNLYRRTWNRYDVGVSRDDRLIALFELSVRDTNVAHALHNGELKLLGKSDGVGITSGRDFAAERGLTPDDVVNVRRRIAAVPVRGLFYIGGGSRGVLDKTTKAAWHETKANGFQGETEFSSAILHPARTVTLRDLLSRLSEQGLYCCSTHLAARIPSKPFQHGYRTPAASDDRRHGHVAMSA